MSSSEKKLTQSETKFLAEYLRLECQQVDRLIACAHRLKQTLTRQVSSSALDMSTGGENIVAEEFTPENIKAADDLTAARNRLLQLLKSLSSQVSTSPSLIELLANAPEPHRKELMNLRVVLKEKLLELSAINTGSQAILVYTMDYYEKFLSGISGVDNTSKVYTSHGKVMPHFQSFTKTTV